MKKKYHSILELLFAFIIFLDILAAFIAAYFAVIYLGEEDWFKSLAIFSVTPICFYIAVVINIIIAKLGI